MCSWSIHIETYQWDDEELCRYSLQSSAITSLLKLWPWSECNHSGMPYFMNHSLNNTFTVVSLFGKHICDIYKYKKEYWKFNADLPRNYWYVKTVRGLIQKMKDIRTISSSSSSSSSSISIRWEYFKFKVREFTMQFSKSKNKQQRGFVFKLVQDMSNSCNTTLILIKAILLASSQIGSFPVF